MPWPKECTPVCHTRKAIDGATPEYSYHYRPISNYPNFRIAPSLFDPDLTSLEQLSLRHFQVSDLIDSLQLTRLDNPIRSLCPHLFWVHFWQVMALAWLWRLGRVGWSWCCYKPHIFIGKSLTDSRSPEFILCSVIIPNDMWDTLGLTPHPVTVRDIPGLLHFP